VAERITGGGTQGDASSPAPVLGIAAAGFAVGVILSSVGASVASAAVGYRSGSGEPLPVAVTVGSVAGLWVGLLGALTVASRRTGATSVTRFAGLRVASLWDVLGGVVAGVASQYLLIPLLYLPAEALDHSLAHQLAKPAQQDTAGVHGVAASVVLFAVLAIGAPVVEELYFRGLVLRGMTARYRPAVAVVATALLFALAHFEAIQFAGLAAFGVVLGTLAHRLGRLGPSVAAHAAFNAAAVLSLLHLGALPGA
jgi:uncharacterized protein